MEQRSSFVIISPVLFSVWRIPKCLCPPLVPAAPNSSPAPSQKNPCMTPPHPGVTFVCGGPWKCQAASPAWNLTKTGTLGLATATTTISITPVTREILDTQESSQLPTRAHFPAILSQNPLRAQRVWKIHISAAADDCAEKGPHCEDPGYVKFGRMVPETAAFRQLFFPCTWPDERPGCAQEHS